MNKFSILFKKPTKIVLSQPEYFYDLNLDKIINQIVFNKTKYNLKPFFYTTLDNIEDIKYRHEILMDLENPKISDIVNAFCFQIENVKEFLEKSQKSFYKHEIQFYFLSAVNNYCNAVFYLSKIFLDIPIKSEGLKIFFKFLQDYTKNERFVNLSNLAANLAKDILKIEFNILLKDATITVSEGQQENFEQEVINIFSQLTESLNKEYTSFKLSLSINHIESQILEKVELLYPETFIMLENFYNQNQDFIDTNIEEFVNQVQFYFAFLDYIKQFEQNYIGFCYPNFTNNKPILIEKVFDIDLAWQLTKVNKQCVANDFYMNKNIAIVTGPNHGGKTTFLRSIAQVAYFSKIGLKVPAKRADIFLFDSIWTHFERQEIVQSLKSRLESDLIRIKTILDNATDKSLIVLNEIFSSTTYNDALFLSKQIIKMILKKGCLCIIVTFMEELCQIEQTESFVAEIDKNQERTFKIVKKSPDGLAYAMSIVSKYRLTKEDLKQRIK
ncbi:MAG: MutS-related protein [Desulfurella sp.]|uniref:MutS-related protein n=1 Tax=Desulfurella sp. TaxID=1962857 RepID=UPI003C9058A7